MANTGYKGWSTLEEFYLDDGTPTGVTKSNIPTDANYVAPVYDPVTCSLEPPPEPLPPTASVDFLVFDIILDDPDHSTDSVDTLAYANTPGLVESGIQVDRLNLKVMAGATDANTSYMATQRCQQDAFGNTLYRYIVDYARIAVLNPGITEFKFRIHLKVTSGSGLEGTNRIFFTRQAGGTKSTITTGTGATGCTTAGATTLNSTFLEPPFPVGVAGLLIPSLVPPFIEVTYNYTTFAMSYTLL